MYKASDIDFLFSVCATFVCYRYCNVRFYFFILCSWGNLEVVQYLVREQRCDKDGTDNEGKTPLHCAAAYV